MKFTAQSKIINSFVFKTFVVVLFATLSFLLFSQNPNQVEASINQSLSYQVKVSNPDGTNLTVTDADCLSGTCNFKASLYDAATGGTLVWQQTIAATVGANGITTLKLDCSGTFSNCNQNGGPNFNSGELFLLVEFQPDAGGAYEAFSPRVELVAAPYAFNAYQLDGYGSGDFVKFIESTAQDDTSTDSSIFINKTGEGGYILQLQDDAVDAFLIDYEGKVGIGAASSSALLQLGTTGKLGTLGFAGSTSGLVTVQPAAAAGTWSMTLPTSAGTNGYVLSTDGNGVTSWVAMSGGVTADSLDYDDFEDTMDLDANLITNQTTYTSTFNYTGTSAAGLTYNADSFSSGNAAIEISADALSSGSALFISSASTAAMDESRSLLRLSSSGANANSDGLSTGIIIETTNTGTNSTNTGISVYTSGASTNYGGYFYLSGSTGTKTGLSSSVSDASSAASYSGYFTNTTTNTTTDTLAKYGIFVSSTGNFPGLSGGATTNYGLYVDTVSGADANYAAVFAGGNVGIGTITPGYQLLVTKNTEALTDADLPHIRVANSNSDQEDGSIKGNVAVVSVSANSEGAGKVEGWLTASYQSDSIIGTGVDFRVVTNHNFNIWTNNTKRMTVLNTGQVGIGTTTPSSPFTVAPSNATQSSVTSAINIGTASGTVPLSMRVDTLDSGYPTLIWLQTKSGDIGYINSGTYNSVGSLTFGSSTGKQIAMYTNDAYSAPTMLLDTSGRVGIGTVAPSTLLQLGTTGKLGTLGFAGSTSGLVTVQPAAAAGTWTLTLPTSAGTNGYVLSTNGSGVTTWSAVTSLVAADTWDYDDFVDTMSLDANLITNQTTYTSTHNYTGTTTTGLTYNADSVTTANAVEISADGLTNGSGVRLSSTSTAGGASVTSSVLYIDRSGTNANNAHISTGINIKVANTGTSSINRGVQSTANGGSNNYAGYFVVNGTTGSKTGLFSWVLNDSSSVSYSGYFANTTTNTTTDALAKYGIFVSSTGNFPGSSGGATTNYGLYVDTVSGADANYAAVFAGGNVGIGTVAPLTLLQLGTTGKLGTLGFAGSTSGLVTVQPAAAAGTWTLTLPTSAGTNGYVLSTDGSGVTTWSAVTSLVAADTWDYDDFVDTMSLDANLITNQTTYTSTHNYTGTTTTGLTYNADSVTTANAMEISADGLTTGSGLLISSTSTAGAASNSSFLLKLSSEGTNANSTHRKYGLDVAIANTGNSASDYGVNVYVRGDYRNYGIYSSVIGATREQWAGYFLASGVDLNYGVYSEVTTDGNSATDASYAGYFTNGGTNIVTDGLSKYGLYVSSSGSFTGSTGTTTNNYGLYVSVAGADNNYSAIFSGGNVGIGTTAPNRLLTMYGTDPYFKMETSTNAISANTPLATIEFAGLDATVTDQVGAKIYAVSDSGWNGLTYDAPTRLEFFVQSDGTSDSMTAPAMTIDSTGYVGVGTQVPSVNLHVYRAADADILRLQDSDGSCLANPEAGAVTWTCSSDISLKEDIQDAGSVLSIIKNIRVRDYRVKASGDRMVGVIAQEFIEVLPNNVVPVEGGLLSVKELSSWQLVKAIQEQQVMIEELQENNTNLGFTVSEIDGVKNLNFEGTIIATNIQAQNIEGMEIISANITTLEENQVTTDQQITEINDQALSQETRIASLETSVANNSARLDQYGSILNRITAISADMYQYNMDIQVLGDMFIDGSLSVSNEAIFSGQILFNQDTVGLARILPGHTEVYVPFTQEYRYQPVITTSILGNNSVNKVYVDEVTTAGFKIKIDAAQAEEVNFNWHAFASPNARLVDSTGVVAGIQTYRPLTGLDQVFVDPLIDSSCVGYVETQGFGETHDGIDLAKYEGCIISSVGVGRVIFAGWEDISGNIVKIDHGNGIVTAYAHGTGEFFVEVGDYVDAGDPIMMMGTTGTSTGIHTHFMLIQDGTAINPKGIIPYNAIY